MNQATIASLANRLALKQVQRNIQVYSILQFIPWGNYKRQLIVFREWEGIFKAREPWLGVGARKRLRGAS